MASPVHVVRQSNYSDCAHNFYDLFTEAIRAITSYTESPVELLKRKKMKRGTLWIYLNAEGVVVQPKAEKHVLMKRILEHWGSTPLKDEDLMDVR